MGFIRIMSVLPLALHPHHALAAESSVAESSAANPVRRVVTLLQKMQTQITEEGKKEEDLFEKFMCYCKTGADDLSASIKAAEAKATALRKKEAGVFAKEDSDHKTNIAALGKAITAVETGAGGSFLQTTAAAKLRQLTIDMDMTSIDRDALAAFLSEGQRYAPQSGEITGILKQMKDTMEKDNADLVANENQAIADEGHDGE